MASTSQRLASLHNNHQYSKKRFIAEHQESNKYQYISTNNFRCALAMMAMEA